MSNEKVVQVIVKGEQVLGLTDSGHLAVFDDNLNAFKIRGKSEVFDRDHKVVLSSVEVTPRLLAMGKYSSESAKKDKETDWVIWLILAFFTFIVGALVFKYATI